MDLKGLLADQNSCLNRLVVGEQGFVLMGRDPAAPIVIRAWAVRRMQLGLNSANDTQILEAFAVAEAMDVQRVALRARLALEDVEARVTQLQEQEDRLARDAQG